MRSAYGVAPLPWRTSNGVIVAGPSSNTVLSQNSQKSVRNGRWSSVAPGYRASKVRSIRSRVPAGPAISKRLMRLANWPSDQPGDAGEVVAMQVADCDVADRCRNDRRSLERYH